MRKTFTYLLATALGLVTLASCANTDIEPDAKKASPTFTASIYGAQSRAIDDYWENGDKIGISGSGSFNVCHVTAHGDIVFTVEDPEQQIYYKESTPVTFTAYYPYHSSINEATKLISFSTADQATQKEFDYLWASGEGSKDNPDVTLNFTHRMCKITLVFKNGKDMDVSDITRCRLSGIITEGTFDTATGICEINEALPTASSTVALYNVTEDEPVPPLFLIPQTVAGQIKLEIYDNNNQYFVCNLTVPDNELVASTDYMYVITVSKTGLHVSSCSLSDWIEMDGNSEASSADE